MSLEKQLQENTEALRELIAVLKAQGNTCSANVPVDKQPAQPREKEPAAETKVDEPLKYEYIQKPFLKLATKDRDAAVALLATLGAKKLDAFKDKPEEFERILGLIEEKLNG